MAVRVLLSCGETSGDLYAAALVRALRAEAPDIEVEGLGGPAFVAAGGRALVDAAGLAVTGFAEIPARLPRLRRAQRQLVERARQGRPDVLVVIDYFGFNSRLARQVAALGIPVVYYVSPQVWAWRPGRVRTIQAQATEMLVIFPFETAIYEAADVPVRYVGHPLVDQVAAAESRTAARASLGLSDDNEVLAVLPGSRASEVRRLLPTLTEAAARLRVARPGLRLLCPRGPGLDEALFAPWLALTGAQLLEGQSDRVLAAADVALLASGTATVQAALHDVPMVVVYRVSPLEYAIGRRFVRVPYFAMVNLLAGRRVVPELIQHDCTPEQIVRAAHPLFEHGEARATMRAGLADVRQRLGGPGASARAAAAILAIAHGGSSWSSR